MKRRTPRYTLTETLCPNTTLGRANNTTPSTPNMALSLVMTSCDGTSSTCSIIDSLRPMPYMYGTMKCRPGENVATYLPKRSIVYSRPCGTVTTPFHNVRSEEHTSELQSLMRISYAVFCLKKKKNTQPKTI